MLSRVVSEDEIAQPGKVYHAEFNAAGISTLIPGWEDSAIDRMNTSLYQQGCEPVYLNVDSQNDTITIQYKLREPAYGEATAMVLPVIVVYAVAIIAVSAAIVIAAWLLSLTLNGGVKELSTTLTDNPMMTPIIYGGLAIVGIVALIYLKDRFSSSDSDKHGV
jgi:hypothetical protein